MKRASLWRWTGGFLAAFALFSGAAAADLTPRLKPPPPPPNYLSSADHERLEAVLNAIDHRDWRRARAEAAAVADPIAKGLADWFYFTAGDPHVDFEEAGAFLDTHPDWPSRFKIQAQAERHIPDSAPTEAVLAFFKSREPVTGEGKLQIARALFDANHDEAAVIHLRDAWINHTFKLSEERRLLARYGRWLREEDHAARIDRLLWVRQVTNARRVFSKLNRRDRRMAEARAALLMRASSGPKLFNALAAEEKFDAGVLHAAVRYYRRTDQEDMAIALARQAPTTPEALRNPKTWWYERQLLMRWALKNGRFADAYAMAAGHGLDPVDDYTDYAEAEFDAGWIALRFLNEPERAEAHFMALAAAVSAPISTARAFYWLGRAAEARGAPELAAARYRRAAAHIYTYYGQLAAEKLGGAPLETKFAPPTVTTPADHARFTSRPVVAALRMLSDLHRDDAFLTFAYRVDDQLETPGEYAELAKLAERKGAPHITVRAGKVGISKGAFAPDVAYPLVYVPDEAVRFAAKEVVLGLSRQESEFNPRAFSRKGARGVMQVLPSTALITARQEGLRYSRAALLDDPGYNMTIGSAHLAHLIDRFGGSYVMAFAAYNAGAFRVDQWIEEFGDPRDPNVDPVDWIELIPFSETRNYVQRVFENTQVYRSRLRDRPIAGELSGDLDRGGPRGRAGGGAESSPVLILAAANVGPQTLPPLPRRTADFAADAAHVEPEVGDKESAPNAPAEEAPSPKESAPDSSPDAAPALSADQAGSARDNTVEPETTGHPAEAAEATNAAPKETITPVAPAAPALQPPTEPLDEAVAEAENEDDPCETYRDFIAETAKEPSAADLNAGMLAELQGGGACKQ